MEVSVVAEGTRAQGSSGRVIASERGPVGYALATAARIHRSSLSHRLGRLGLHLGQELVIVDLHERPDSTQAELVGRLGIEQPTVAKTLARMEHAGFVTRVRDDQDRRQVRLRLTPRGRRCVPSVLKAWAAADAESTRAMSDADRRRLVGLLQKLSSHGDG